MLVPGKPAVVWALAKSEQTRSRNLNSSELSGKDYSSGRWHLWAGLITSSAAAVAGGLGRKRCWVLVAAHTVAATADVDHDGVVNEAVDDGAGHDLVGEDLAPNRRSHGWRSGRWVPASRSGD